MPDNPQVIVRSAAVEEDDVSESVVEALIDEIGTTLPNHFDVLIVVTVVVTPLPD